MSSNNQMGIITSPWKEGKKNIKGSDKNERRKYKH
jgi:hypothetical protein